MIYSRTKFWIIDNLTPFWPHCCFCWSRAGEGLMQTLILLVGVADCSAETVTQCFLHSAYCLFIAKPSMKIESVNKAFLFWYWQWLKKYFFRNKTFLFFKIESWNFQHLFEKEFLENLSKFQINQTTEKMEIKIVWMSWKVWDFT